MWNDEQLKAALEAEAARARVDAPRLYRRIQQAQVTRPRRRFGSLLEVGVAATLLLVAGGLLLGRMPTAPRVPASSGSETSTPPRATPTVPPAQSSDQPPSPREPGSAQPYLEAPARAYTNADLGFTLAYPSLFEEPYPDATEPDQVILPFGWGSLTIRKEPPPGDYSLSALTTQAFDAMRKEHQRYMPLEFGTRELAGRQAGYFSYYFVSAAAGFTREVYLVPVEDRLYRVTCGSDSGAGASWTEVKQICDQVAATLTFDGAAQEEGKAVGDAGVLDYRPWGLSLQYPTAYGAVSTEGGRLALPLDDWGELMIERLPSPGQSPSVLVRQAVQEIEQQPRHVIMEQGLRRLAGREAGYFSYSAVSATAGFSREVYLLPVDEHLYRITCGSIGGSRTPWKEAKPVCDQILSTLIITP